MNKRLEARIRKLAREIVDLKIEDERYRALCVHQTSGPLTDDERRKHEADWAVVRFKLHEAQSKETALYYGWSK